MEFDITEPINNCIKKLDYKWFKEKERSFKRHTGYNITHNIIEVKIGDFSIDYIYDEKGEEIVGEEIIDCTRVEEIDLRQFCNCFLPLDSSTYYGKFFSEESSDPDGVVVSDVAREIKSTLIKFLNGISDIDVVNKSISVTFQNVGNAIIENKTVSAKSKENLIYADVMSDLVSITSSSIYKHFSREMSLHSYKSRYTDKLQFNLKITEMMALMYIINRAGLLRTGGINDTTFLDFCFDHFQSVLKGQPHSVTDIKVLRNEYTEIMSLEQTPSLRNIRDKLMPILKQIV